ncbi:MAG: hypothetical protein EA401_02565 [Planctomycetota bacterium]|nr:MAG: hypothetical protein EA401_02565 [Planctomycetota bacterium]
MQNKPQITKLQQLQTVIDVLHAQGLRCWIDTGTLLGLVRHKQILPWDRDIDISCFAHNRDSATKAMQQLATEYGYKMQTRSYRGQIFKIELMPKNRSDYVKIDLSFWWVSGDWAYSLMVCNMPLRLRRNSLLWWLAQTVRQPMIHLVWPPLKRSRSLHLPLLGVNIGIYLWRVPCSALAKLSSIEINSFAYPAPADWESYLTFRYGNWRVPKRDWLAPIDDGASLLVPPEDQLFAQFAEENRHD